MIKNLLLFLLSLGVGFTLVFVILQQSVPPAPHSTNQKPMPTITPFSFEKPPKDSLTGSIDISGDVAFESRIATEPAKITTLQLAQQGERIVTGTGSATVQFKDIASLFLSPTSDLDIVQTLPVNFVFNQHAGTIMYNRLGTIPLSIRTLHLLIDMDPGEITVTTDTDDETVWIDVKSGKVTVAYNDLHLQTQIVTAVSGEQLYFHDDTRRIYRE